MLLAALLLQATLGASAVDERRPPPAPGPDVLLILIDDLGWDEVDFIDTPTFDTLAARGVEFDRFYSMPVCSPTRYATLFGRYGYRVGLGTAVKVTRPDDFLGAPVDDVSLADFLGGAGYRTGVFGKWHLSNVNAGELGLAPLKHGFDTWRAGVPGNVTDYYDWDRVDDGVTTRETAYNTSAITDAAIEWWKTTEGPRFGYVAYQGVHHPYQAPPSELADTGGRESFERFAAMVRALDLELARLLSHVDLERTLLLVACDNGTGTRVSLDGAPAKGSVYDDGVRVPLWVLGPGVAQGRASGLCHAVDLFATIAELAGLSLPDEVAEDSRSLAGALIDPGISLRPWVFVQEFKNGSDRMGKKAILLEEPLMKLMRLQNGDELLFDLSVDPDEVFPLDPEFPWLAEPVGRMRGLIEELETDGA